MAASNESSGPAGAYRRQDGQIVGRMVENDEPHVQQRWDERCPAGWEGYNVRAAWREGVVVLDVGDSVHRLHKPTGLVVVAEFAFLTTVYEHSEPDSSADAEDTA